MIELYIRTLQSKIGRRLELMLLTALVTIFVAWYAWPLVGMFSDDERLLQTFSSDQAKQQRLVRTAIEERNPSITFSAYGHLNMNLVLWPMMVKSLFSPVSTQQIIVALRLESVVATIGVVAVTFALARRYFGSLTAWLASLLLLVVPYVFLRASVGAKPEVVQLFFLVLGIYFCCRLAEEQRWKWLVFASISAGLAFASKYAGAFLLPVIWMVVGAQALETYTSGSEQIGSKLDQMKALLASSLRKVVVSLTAFLGAFFLASPYSWVGLRFVTGIREESYKARYGHGFDVDTNPLVWFERLLSPIVLDEVILGLASISLVLTAYSVWRVGWRRGLRLSPHVVIWAWVILFLGYAMLRVNVRYPHYLLPIIPALVILAVQAPSQVMRYAAANIPGKLVTVILIGAALGIAALEVPKSIEGIVDKRQERAANEETKTAVLAGRWLEEQFSPSSRILYEGAYVPPSFCDTRNPSKVTLKSLENFDPDIVIISGKKYRRMLDPDRETRNQPGEESYEIVMEAYEAILDGTAGYTLARDFGSVQVHVRSDGPIGVVGDSQADCDTVTERRRLTQTIAELDEDIRLKPNAVRAYNQRGRAYRKLGQPERAIQDHSMAIQNNPQSASAYVGRALAYAMLQDDELAQRDFNQALELGFDRADLESKFNELKNPGELLVNDP